MLSIVHTTYMIHVLCSGFRFITSIWNNPKFDWECTDDGRDRAMSLPASM